jgi:hypothetical protein
MLKLFEKLILMRLNPIIEEKHLVPTHQFGFSKNDSTIAQVLRITDIFERNFESKGVCSAVFLDIAQAFERVWHTALLHKLSILPDYFYQVLNYYLTNRLFCVKLEGSYSELKPIKAGVPQGSVLGPVSCLLYINDVPNTLNSTMATFADDTAGGKTDENSTRKLQSRRIILNKS